MRLHAKVSGIPLLPHLSLLVSPLENTIRPGFVVVLVGILVIMAFLAVETITPKGDATAFSPLCVAL